MSEKIISEANLNKSGAYPGWKAKAAADKAAEDAAQAAKTEVTVTQVQGSTNGTKIATIGVDSVSTDVYAPAVSVTQVQGSSGATKIATVAVGEESTDIYAPESSGAEEFVVNFNYTATQGDLPSGGANGYSVEEATITADKTGAEVYAAIQAGKKIVPKINYGVGSGSWLPNIITDVTTFEQNSELYVAILVANFWMSDGCASPDEYDGIIFTGVIADSSDEVGDWAFNYDDSGYRYFYTPQA